LGPREASVDTNVGHGGCNLFNILIGEHESKEVTFLRARTTWCPGCDFRELVLLLLFCGFLSAIFSLQEFMG